MCEPATAMMALTAAGTAMSAISAYQNGQAQQQQLNMKAESAMRDAASADAQARRAGEVADMEQQRVGQQEADIHGKQAAAAGANGVDLTYGSTAGTLAQTDYYGLNDQMTAARNGQDQDYALRNKADQLRRTGAFDQSQAGAINPWMSAGGTLLTGAGKVAGQWYDYSKVAVNDGGYSVGQGSAYGGTRKGL